MMSEGDDGLSVEIVLTLSFPPTHSLLSPLSPFFHLSLQGAVPVGQSVTEFSINEEQEIKQQDQDQD